MAILHTPRTLTAIARGILKRRQRPAANGTGTPIDDSSAVPSPSSSSSSADPPDIASRIVGFVPPQGSYKDHNNNAHVYRSRPNVLWDVDYLGHMNNSSYLTHAEYARWEWMAENGSLERMYTKGIHFMVTHSAVRFRKEIGLRGSFEIHSLLHAIDDRHMWLHQTFRDGNRNAEKTPGKGRILAQVLVQAVAVKNRKVVPPSSMMEVIGVPEDMIDALLWSDDNDPKVIANNDDDDDDGISFLERFRDLDEAFRKEATADDERLRSNSTRDY